MSLKTFYALKQTLKRKKTPDKVQIVNKVDQG